MILAIVGLTVLGIVALWGSFLVWREVSERREGREAIEQIQESLSEADELMATIREQLASGPPDPLDKGTVATAADVAAWSTGFNALMRYCRDFEQRDWLELLRDYPRHQYSWLEAILAFESAPTVTSTDTGSLVARTPSSRLMLEHARRGRVA